MKTLDHPGNITWINKLLALIQEFRLSVTPVEGPKTSTETEFSRKDTL